jgi:hypothetical protein
MCCVERFVSFDIQSDFRGWWLGGLYTLRNKRTWTLP